MGKKKRCEGGQERWELSSTVRNGGGGHEVVICDTGKGETAGKIVSIQLTVKGGTGGVSRWGAGGKKKKRNSITLSPICFEREGGKVSIALKKGGKTKGTPPTHPPTQHPSSPPPPPQSPAPPHPPPSVR